MGVIFEDVKEALVLYIDNGDDSHLRAATKVMLELPSVVANAYPFMVGGGYYPCGTRYYYYHCCASD